MIKIRIVPQTLTDGSVAYDVHVEERSDNSGEVLQRINLPAYDREHATKLARDLAGAVNDHSTEEAVVWNEL